MTKIPLNYRKQSINSCYTCQYKFEDFDLYCFLTIESLPTLEEDRSFLSMFYIDEIGICDRWENEAKMDEKIKEIEKHEWDSHPTWHLANTGWYQCKICNKEHFCKIIPPVFPPEICETRVLKAHIKELETALDITAGALEGSQGVVRELEENIGKLSKSVPIGLNLNESIEWIIARKEDLEDGIEGILNQKDLISFAIQKQLEELIKEKP